MVDQFGKNSYHINWVDNESVVNYPDDDSKVPFSYRDQVEVRFKIFLNGGFS